MTKQEKSASFSLLGVTAFLPLLTAAVLFFVASQTQAKIPTSIKVVSTQSISVLSSKGKTLRAASDNKLIGVRVIISEKPGERLVLTNLDFTVRYRYRVPAHIPGLIVTQETVSPCEGMRWHGPEIDEGKAWQLLPAQERGQKLFVGVAQRTSGSDYLDLAFQIDKDAEDVVLLHTIEVSPLVESTRPARDVVTENILPPFKGLLNKGPNEVRITNPNDFRVSVGLRSGDRGKDFDVGAHGVSSVYVENGKYDIYFVYSTKPDALFQGDSFQLKNHGVEIQIVRVVGGNYDIKRIK